MSQVEKHLEITSKSVVFLVVDNLANFLNQYPTSRVAITGYTDSSEPAAYNLKLSEIRAQAVTDYPISAGIEEARLTATGYSENSSIADNSSHGGGEKNRRVEIVIPSFEY